MLGYELNELKSSAYDSIFLNGFVRDMKLLLP